MNAPAESGIKDPPASIWGILKSIGPGLIITANIVGTGELIATTMLGAETGFRLLWFILLSCFIKIFCCVEMGRYTISEGVSSLDAINRIPGKFVVSWLVWLWVPMYLGTLCQMGGMVGGLAELFAGKTTGAPHAVAAVAMAASCSLLLGFGRYKLVESGSTLMVFLFTMCTLAAVAALRWSPYRITAGNLADGLSFGLPDKIATAFMAFGITGVGAAELMFYPIWCLEKGYARACGPRDDSPQWFERARGWLKVMRVDAWVSMVLYTTATVAFYLLGAAVLHARGEKVANDTLVSTLSQMYEQTFGPAGKIVFAVGAFMVLYSTLFVSTASNARLAVDAGGLFRLLPSQSPERRTFSIKIGVILIPLLVLGIYYVSGKATVTLVLIGAFLQAILLPFLAFAAVYFRHRGTHPALRPGMLWTIVLWASFLSMAVLGVYNTWQGIPKVRALLGL